MTVLWIWLWKIVFVISVAMFAIMAIATSIGGAADIKKLFQRLSSEVKEKK